jgi:nitrogen fixation protein FixH
MNAKPLNGRKVLAILVGSFGMIFAANLALVVAATGTFPGLVVANSYVASQQWNARTDAQKALGWTASVAHEHGELRVAVTGRHGQPVRNLSVTAVVGRPASGRDDVTLTLDSGAGAYVAPIVLRPGLWRVVVDATDGAGEHFEAEAELRIAGRL